MGGRRLRVRAVAAFAAVVLGAGSLGSCARPPEESGLPADSDADDTNADASSVPDDTAPPYRYVSECWTDNVPSGAGYAETLAAHEGQCFQTARFVEGCDAAVYFMISNGESWSNARFDATGAPVTRCYGRDHDFQCPSEPQGTHANEVCAGSRARCEVVEHYDSPGCVPAEVAPPAWSADTCERLDWAPPPTLLADHEAALQGRCYGRATCASPEGAARVVIVESDRFQDGPPPTVDVYDAVSGERVARWQPYGGSTCPGGTWSGPAHPDCYGAPFEGAGTCGVVSLP